MKQHFYFFIIGTIIGTIVFTLKNEKSFNLKNLGIFIIVILVFLLIERIKPPFNSGALEVTGSVLGMKITKIDFGYSIWLAICGLLAAGSMLLPGFSGSALLVSLGEYENIIGFVDERIIIPIGIIGIGAVLGILYCSKLISKLMKKYPIQMIYVIVALMVTSIYKLFSEISSEFLASQILISIITCIIGYFASFLLSSKKGN
jgi:putative membrane protein